MGRMPLLIHVRPDVYNALKTRAIRERTTLDQIIEEILIDQTGIDKPIPNPKPMIITILKEPAP